MNLVSGKTHLALVVSNQQSIRAEIRLLIADQTIADF